MLRRVYRYIFKPYRKEYRGTINDDEGRRVKCYRRVSRWEDFWEAVFEFALYTIERLMGMAIPLALVALIIAWLIRKE